MNYGVLFIISLKKSLYFHIAGDWKKQPFTLALPSIETSAFPKVTLACAEAAPPSTKTFTLASANVPVTETLSVDTLEVPFTSVFVNDISAIIRYQSVLYLGRIGRVGGGSQEHIQVAGYRLVRYFPFHTRSIVTVLCIVSVHKLDSLGQI